MADGVGTTHHVEIGSDFFLVKQGTYSKRPAPIFGARFTTGDPDYNTLSFWQHWVQRCWIGGLDAQEWQDDAMFYTAAGVDTTNHEVLLLARDLSNSDMTNSKFSTEGSTAYEREFFSWNGADGSGREGLYCLTYGPTSGSSWLTRWIASTTTWTAVHTFSSLRTRSQAQFNDAVYFGTQGSNLAKMTGDPGSESFATVAKPAAVSAHVPYTMCSYAGNLYVGFGNQIWRLKSDDTWDGSTAFHEAPGVNYFTKMEVHLGFLYIASQNGHILRTDGNNTFDMWQMGSNQGITDIRSFDGRLFIATVDPIEGANGNEAVLYQFSGAAVTELKRFGRLTLDVRLGRLRVVGSRMFFGAPSLLGFDDYTGFGIGMYDPVEDSYHVFATNRDSATYSTGTYGENNLVDDVYLWGNWLFVSVRKHGIFRTKYKVRDAEDLLRKYDTTAAGADTSAGNGGWLTSSDFDAGTPGLLKLWRSVHMTVDLPNSACSVTVEYSTDGGDNWTTAGVATKTGSAKRYNVEYVLGTTAGGPVYAPRIMYRLTLRTTNTTYSPAVRGIAFRYVPIPEPNWVWNMTLVLSDTQELLDDTVQSPDGPAKLAALEAAFRSQALVYFKDLDGTEWVAGGEGVRIDDMRVFAPYVGPSSDGDIEYEVNITLMEAVEAYES